MWHLATAANKYDLCILDLKEWFTNNKKLLEARLLSILFQKSKNILTISVWIVWFQDAGLQHELPMSQQSSMPLWAQGVNVIFVSWIVKRSAISFESESSRFFPFESQYLQFVFYVSQTVTYLLSSSILSNERSRKSKNDDKIISCLSKRYCPASKTRNRHDLHSCHLRIPFHESWIFHKKT